MRNKTKKLKKGECKDIAKVEIQFENTEIFSFTKEEITNIFLNHIVKNISMCLNAVIEDYEAQDVWFVLPYETATRKEKIFGFDEEQTLLDRLGLTGKREIRDITHFYITYNTNETECISCVWEGDDNLDNPAQVAEIEELDGCKYLIISISKDNIK